MWKHRSKITSATLNCMVFYGKILVYLELTVQINLDIITLHLVTRRDSNDNFEFPLRGYTSIKKIRFNNTLFVSQRVLLYRGLPVYKYTGDRRRERIVCIENQLGILCFYNKQYRIFSNNLIKSH